MVMAIILFRLMLSTLPQRNLDMFVQLSMTRL
jgi:hypothetical protein